jgi:uncharacterized membrane protein YagU involved in acid resistance
MEVIDTMARRDDRRGKRGASVWKGAVAGLVGGLVASYAMDQFQAAWIALASRGAGTAPGSGGPEQEPATVKAASAVSEGLFAHELTKAEKQVGGAAVHYAVGGLTGALYGAAVEAEPAVAAGVGLPYGTAVWLVVDEGAVPALGLSKPVTEYPLSNHVYALVSHFVLGFTTDVVRRGVRRML